MGTGVQDLESPAEEPVLDLGGNGEPPKVFLKGLLLIHRLDTPCCGEGLLEFSVSLISLVNPPDWAAHCHEYYPHLTHFKIRSNSNLMQCYIRERYQDIALHNKLSGVPNLNRFLEKQHCPRCHFARCSWMNSI